MINSNFEHYKVIKASRTFCEQRRSLLPFSSLLNTGSKRLSKPSILGMAMAISSRKPSEQTGYPIRLIFKHRHKSNLEIN